MSAGSERVRELWMIRASGESTEEEDVISVRRDWDRVDEEKQEVGCRDKLKHVSRSEDDVNEM